jgi:hypothetical protein
MKILFISLSTPISLYYCTTICLKWAKNIETYPYVVDKNTTHLKSAYEASLFTAVKLSTKEFKEASSQGFSILAGYILKIKRMKKYMTSPVTMSLEDSMTVMFMVPKNLIKKRFQSQANRRSNFDKNQQKTVAAITFGWADDTKIEKYKEKLKAALTLKE